MAQNAGQNAPAPASDVPALQQQLYDPALKQDQRDAVAQRLLSRPDPAAHKAIADGLQQYGQPSVQLASARALGDSPTADPQFIRPLFALLDTNMPEQTIDAAARGLTAFKADDNVLTQLLDLTRNASDERVRVAAVRSAGTFVDQRAAQTLVDLLDPSAASPRVNTAAAESLAYLSGLDAAGTTTEGWRNWWNNNKGKSAVQFRADIELARSAAYDRSQTTVADLQTEFLRLLSDQYQHLSPNQRPDTLIRYLRSPEAAIRVIGCKIVRQSAENADVPQNNVKDQLRTLIGDANPSVRAAAGDALALINDPQALQPLLTQLNQETDPNAKAALVRALRPIGDINSTRMLLTLLNDPSVEVASASADALAELGPRLRQQDPALANETAEKLLDTLKKRTNSHDDSNLRYALVNAMIPLQSRTLERSFVQMANDPTEVPRVRRALLTAMGALHDPQLADTIVPFLSDPDLPVRLAAIKALGASGVSLGQYDRQLSDLIDPTKGQPQEVRDATWNVLTGLFAKAPLNQLTIWETMPGVKNDPLKLLAVYREERTRYTSKGDQDNVGSKNQQIGDACSQANLWQEAIVAYTDALTYAKQANKPFMVELASEGKARALLMSRQYEDAVKFIQTEITENRSLEGTLGPMLPMEAERLANEAKDYDASLQLISLTLNMQPPLRPQFTQRMKDLQSQVQKRTREQNLTPYPTQAVPQNA